MPCRRGVAGRFSCEQGIRNNMVFLHFRIKTDTREFVYTTAGSNASPHERSVDLTDGIIGTISMGV